MPKIVSMKVLIADDDAVVRTFVQRVVEHASHEVLLADNGREALEIAQREDPDLLITDIHMPELDGTSLIAALRALPRHARLPIICLSSMSKPEEVSRLIELRIAAYVLKPVRPTDLLARVRAVLLRDRNWKELRAPQELVTA